MTQYDYIIVGAGSAGCILANRLSESGKHQVLLVEAGGKDTHPWFKIPMGYGKLYKHPKHNWRYQTIPQPNLNQRALYTPRGKVQGGSGSINAMIYVRGAAHDFDDWAQATNSSIWRYEHVLPTFKKLEHHWLSDSEHHSRQGKIHIESLRSGMHPVCQHYLDACHALGYRENKDFNGAQLEGYGIYDANIHRGVRDSSSRAYLKPALVRDNLTVLHHSLVMKIHVKPQPLSSKTSEKPLRASHIDLIQNGIKHRFSARKEIILSAGVIETPKLLELSGIGNSAHLIQHGISPVKHLPAVGEHVQDHLCASYYYQTKVETLNRSFSTLWGQAKMGLQYILNKGGPLAMSVNQTGGFFKGQPKLSAPNLQLYFNPLSYTIPTNSHASVKPDPYPSVLLAFNACRPESRGSIHIQSPRMDDHPAIHPNYLSTEKDIREVIQGSRLIRRIVSANALNDIIIAEKQPGIDVQSDDELVRYFKENAGSIYHLCGSCRMGIDESGSVVDAELNVWGISGLRIVDASIFPNITSGNTNAPVMMVAEKAAELITQATPSG